ncbi:hypothetical protein CYLTODRAFT_154847 [Cylindrobasidium torrendii FP15055 ss-10]|uniref:Uncharacterized protein n=1 Tax=Cylindrobasidium torrendii FP15055 ss-10 TaxID=1314674 RepID=A0A0D7BUL5_9AGAR|nr:hypothetical protein CYLTODRAFT_154847 [Cylindrobasidium torrendii FP15055 ss-10]
MAFYLCVPRVPSPASMWIFLPRVPSTLFSKTASRLHVVVYPASLARLALVACDGVHALDMKDPGTYFRFHWLGLGVLVPRFSLCGGVSHGGRGGGGFGREVEGLRACSTRRSWSFERSEVLCCVGSGYPVHSSGMVLVWFSCPLGNDSLTVTCSGRFPPCRCAHTSRRVGLLDARPFLASLSGLRGPFRARSFAIYLAVGFSVETCI